MKTELTDFEKTLQDIVNSYIDGDTGKMTDEGAIYYAKKLLLAYIPTKNHIYNIWELGNIWKEDRETLEKECTQLKYIQDNWKNGDYYGREES